jgi:hypothetical protein
MSQDNSVVTWLNFALQQMAAESYLHDVARTNEVELLKRLKLGNNNILTADSDDPTLPGKTRMTTLQAEQFIQRYEIVDHHANDASGFSATLLFDRETDSYTLSFRSTEPRLSLEGGDVERDGLFALGLTPAADGEIGLDGFAFGQLIAMERYYLELTTSGKLPAGAELNVTGYSLGGRLATVFTQLYANQVAETTAFNALGRGQRTAIRHFEKYRYEMHCEVPVTHGDS